MVYSTVLGAKPDGDVTSEKKKKVEVWTLCWFLLDTKLCLVTEKEKKTAERV